MISPIIAALSSALAPVLHLLAPGLGLARLTANTKPLGWLARVILWSVTTLSVGTWVWTWLGLSVIYVWPIAFVAVLTLLWKRKLLFSATNLTSDGSSILLFLLAAGLLARDGQAWRDAMMLKEE